MKAFKYILIYIIGKEIQIPHFKFKRFINSHFNFQNGKTPLPVVTFKTQTPLFIIWHISII